MFAVLIATLQLTEYVLLSAPSPIPFVELISILWYFAGKWQNVGVGNPSIWL